jgi:hypothetical protein
MPIFPVNDTTSSLLPPVHCYPPTPMSSAHPAPLGLYALSNVSGMFGADISMNIIMHITQVSLGSVEDIRVQSTRCTYCTYYTRTSIDSKPIRCIMSSIR